MHWILAPEPPVPRLSLPIVEDLISSQGFISSENAIVWMKQKLMINEQQIQQVIKSFMQFQRRYCTINDLIIFIECCLKVEMFCRLPLLP